MTNTVTVRKYGKQRYKVEFSRLPGEVFGPWDFATVVRDLTVSALLTPMQSRNLVLDAATIGSASAVIQ